MTQVTRISRKELTARQIVDILHDGGRVLIELSILGQSTRVVIRLHEGTYYCDTPMMLLRHETEEELRECLERYRLTKPEAEATAEVAQPAV